MKKLLLALMATVLVFAAATVESRAGFREMHNQVYFQLVFGMGVGSNSVSPDIVRDFIDKEVASRFPAGMSVETAVHGQWMSAKGLIREKNAIVNVIADDTPESHQKVKEIGELYAKRFAGAKASLFVIQWQIPKTQHYF